MTDPNIGKEQIQSALKGLDLTDVAFKLSQMALKIISGKEIEEKTYNVSLTIPKELGELFELFSEKVGIDIEKMLSHIAKEGFNESLKNRISREQKPEQSTLEQTAQAVGFDMKGLQDKMGQFQNVVSRLQEVQKVFEDVHNPTPTKNNEQSNIPLGSTPCPKSREK